CWIFGKKKATKVFGPWNREQKPSWLGYSFHIGGAGCCCLICHVCVCPASPLGGEGTLITSVIRVYVLLLP
ncbi:MAG: hypothetical protein KJ846_02915, partial [Proteobacteria bacterium]|nr:hypothetical protein [Pseudomonadota bacterium]